MKKFYSLVAACLFVLAANANYYLVGECVGWNAPNTNYEFVEVDGVLTVEVAQLYGNIKVTVSAPDATGDAAWHPQYGAAKDAEDNVVPLELNKPYVLVREATEGGEAVDLPVKVDANYVYENAKLTLAVSGDQLTLTLVAGTPKYVATLYYLVGGFNGWSLETAVPFNDVNGVLTANVEDLNGTFKIIYDRKWGTEYCSNGSGLAKGEAYVTPLVASNGGNISLANPFGGYKNAVLTLAAGEDDNSKVLTLVDGEFYVTQNDWFIPGEELGWECKDAQKFSPVADKENTYEILLSEFGKDFKVVYGSWAVEFGANNAEDKWEIGKHYIMTYPCAGNLYPAEATIYQDVTVTIVVDYEKVEVDLLIETEAPAAIEDQLINADKVVKTIENGQVVIIRNGQRFNVLGARL